MKKVLAFLTLVSIASPALAWDNKAFFVRNNWTPKNSASTELMIDSITFGASPTFVVREVLPGEVSSFRWPNPGTHPCAFRVTITQRYGPNVTSPNLFNGCTQSTITVSTKIPGDNSQYNFTFN